MSDTNNDADIQLSVQTASIQASTSQLVNSLVEKSEYAGFATSEFRKACKLVEAGILDEAEKLLTDLASEKLRIQFYATWKEYDRLNALALKPLKDYPKIKKVDKRMPPAAIVREVYERDFWACRWCGTPVIADKPIKAMHKLFPVTFYKGTTNDSMHGLMLSSRVSLDHVLPHSFGGTNEIENLVTSCWPCQFGRGNDLIERLGLSDPRERDPIPSDWDGCSRFKF
jgi:5-methylcytosine-specific restriction endonuclease McrA